MSPWSLEWVVEAKAMKESPAWAPGPGFPRTEGRMEKGGGQGECPSVVSRSASATGLGSLGLGVCLFVTGNWVDRGDVGGREKSTLRVLRKFCSGKKVKRGR